MLSAQQCVFCSSLVCSFILASFTLDRVLMSSHSLPHHMAHVLSSPDSHFLDPQMPLILNEARPFQVESYFYK